MDREEMLGILRRKDSSYRERFFSAISSTGIVCMIDCPAKVHQERNITFYERLDDAINEGYRPCKLCMKDKAYPELKRYTTTVLSPLGRILLASDGEALTSLRFNDTPGVERALNGFHVEERELPIFEDARYWLETYFAGQDPKKTLRTRICGSSFLREVCQEVANIPYGRTLTFSALASELARRHGRKRSARTVGGAVRRSPMSIIVPCHRVVRAGGCITGHGGGAVRKTALLRLEGAVAANMKCPVKESRAEWAELDGH
ncbi:methylated-DNA--[protein]-cysteine S-methyltransferase [Actinomyces oricola]|mgnify:CR=1 FL=1